MGVRLRIFTQEALVCAYFRELYVHFFYLLNFYGLPTQKLYGGDPFVKHPRCAVNREYSFRPTLIKFIRYNVQRRVKLCNFIYNGTLFEPLIFITRF